MNEMMERLTQAICGLLNEPSAPEIARTAVEAMRNPTQGMIEAGNRDEDGFNRGGITPDMTAEIYKAMIDKILE